MSSPEPSQALTDFVATVELSQISCYELSAARGQLDGDGGRVVVGPGNVDDLEVLSAENQLGVYWLATGGQFLVRLLATLGTNAGDLRVGVQGEYLAEGLTRDDVSPDVEEEYVNRVAIMTLVPYVRQAIADLSARVFGNTLTLGVIRPGEIAFTSSRRPENVGTDAP